MRTIALALFIGLASTFSIGCGAAAQQQGAVSIPTGAKMPGTAQVGDKTVCPVSGEEFTVAADSPKAELDGKTYYFCCPGCVKKFQAEPQKFLGRLPKPAA